MTFDNMMLLLKSFTSILRKEKVEKEPKISFPSGCLISFWRVKNTFQKTKIRNKFVKTDFPFSLYVIDIMIFIRF